MELLTSAKRLVRIVFVVLWASTTCWAYGDEPGVLYAPGVTESATPVSDELTLVEPEPNAVVDLSPKAQLEYKSPEERGWETPYSPNSVKHGVAECSRPTPVVFRWNAPEDKDARFTLQLIARRGVGIDCEIECGSVRFCEATNLDVGETYYWRVKSVSGAKVAYSETRTFTTADTLPRWFDVSGVSNVRDAGGWKTSSGKRVRKGMVYRGTEFDGHFQLTDEGRRFLVEKLGIHVDFDLRGPNEWGNVADYASPLGRDDVRRLNFPIGAYDAILKDEQKKYYRDIFKAFADPESYPLYVHCWGGADRTGTVVMALNAILGVSDDDLCRDYEMTTLSTIGERSILSKEAKSLFDALDRFGEKSDPLSVKFENYAKSIGVTQDELDSIRAFLLEEDR